MALVETSNHFGDAMQDDFAEWEREEIAKRTQDGLLKKCRSDLVINRMRGLRLPSQPRRQRPRVSEPKMEVARRIFRSVAAGTAVGSVRRSLERDGIPTPSVIGR